MATTQKRWPKGNPRGGQFAPQGAAAATGAAKYEDDHTPARFRSTDAEWAAAERAHEALGRWRPDVSKLSADDAHMVQLHRRAVDHEAATEHTAPPQRFYRYALKSAKDAALADSESQRLLLAAKAQVEYDKFVELAGHKEAEKLPSPFVAIALTDHFREQGLAEVHVAQSSGWLGSSSSFEALRLHGVLARGGVSGSYVDEHEERKATLPPLTRRDAGVVAVHDDLPDQHGAPALRWPRLVDRPRDLPSFYALPLGPDGKPNAMEAATRARAAYEAASEHYEISPVGLVPAEAARRIQIIREKLALANWFHDQHVAAGGTLSHPADVDAQRHADLERYAGEMYRLNQVAMRRAGASDPVKLYRGVSFENGADVPVVGTQARIVARPASSWSTEPAVALRFADSASQEGGAVLRAEVPRSRVYSSYHLFANLSGEQEHVVLGAEDLRATATWSSRTSD